MVAETLMRNPPVQRSRFMIHHRRLMIDQNYLASEEVVAAYKPR
ncbi:MAG: hypothetical protein ACFB4J_15090 [Elainellaceae cyanobacterium]